MLDNSAPNSDAECCDIACPSAAKTYEATPYGGSPQNSRLFQKILGVGYLNRGF